jgi:hypothetical protein
VYSSGPTYITPDQVFTLAPLGAIPRADVPGKLAGRIGPVVHTGASTGALSVLGFVVDAYPTIVKVVVPGDIGVAQFAFSTDGTTFSDPVLSDPNALQNQRWDYELGITGIQIQATNGSGSPNSFLLNDTWTFTTSASPWVQGLCIAVSEHYRKYMGDVAQALGQTGGQTITDINQADLLTMAQWIRCVLVSGRGEVPKEWLAERERAEKLWRITADGDLRPNVAPDADVFVYPQIMRPRPAYSGTDRIPGTGRGCGRRFFGPGCC